MSDPGFPGILQSITQGGAQPPDVTPLSSAPWNILRPYMSGSQPAAADTVADTNAQTGGLDDPRAVHSLTGGTVTTAGWQNPADQNSGLGWRVWITDGNGNRMGYGHMDPSSTPPVGAVVNPGDNLGVYANPTNGASTAPHVHVQAYDPNGNPMNPGSQSPVQNGRMTTRYGGTDAMTGKPGHNGVDWAAPR